MKGDGRRPSLADKVAFLKRPGSFPESTTRVEAIETHMSWVFLTDDYAYKLKKPVRFKLLNLATLEDRRRNCEAEVTCNRRLAPGVYLGVVPLGLDGEGRLLLGSEGEVVDWLVRMHRLPAERMLDRLIAAGKLERSELRRVAETLARFYQGAPRASLGEEDYRLRFVRDVEEIVRELEDLSPIPRARIHAVASALLRFARDRADVLRSRVRGGRVVEAHGDLRPEHVCVLREPVIIDCLEFDPELRLLDPADELSFLVMECELARGPAFIEPELFAAYRARTSDRPPPSLVRFYKTFRAFLRAKISIWHLKDPDVTDSERWISKTSRYVEAAERLAHQGMDGSEWHGPSS